MKGLLAFLLVMFLAFPGYAQFDEPEKQPVDELKLTILSTRGLNYDGTVDKINYDFDIELADSAAKRSTGMMFRKTNDDDLGMLFVFPEKTERERRFWMKNTFIPLDIIFIRKDGTISHIAKNAKPHDETPIPSNGPVYAVLEINGNLTDEYEIKVGDTVHHPIFGNVLAELPPIK